MQILDEFYLIEILFSLFLTFLIIFCGIYIAYFVFLRNCAKKPWKLEIDKNFQPKISILIPVYNEEDVIEKKLENVESISYPKEKIEMIVADDASEDKSLMKVEDFIKYHPELNIRVVRQNPRGGKSAVLNAALPVSSSSIVIVSDADTYWPPDILEKALPYLADPNIGAVTGRGINENMNQSWITRAEDTYLNFAYLIRLGESKLYSTIRFEGGFCAYKKGTFDEFDHETGSDDSGTALEVIQHNHRAILAPEAIFYTSFPTGLSGKLKIKARRANQLISLWVKCFRLMLQRRLILPKKIAIPEIMLFIFGPIVLFALIATTVTTILVFPFSFFSIAILLFIGVLLLFARRIFIEVLFDNLILLYALMSFLLGRRYVAWEKA